MSAQFVQNGRDRLTPSTQIEDNPLHWTHNPELLHWRADVLLDEMMLGAVDLAATAAPLRNVEPVAQSMGIRSAPYRSAVDLHQSSTQELDSHAPVASALFTPPVAPATTTPGYSNVRQGPHALRERATPVYSTPDSLPSDRSASDRIAMNRPSMYAEDSARPSDWENGTRHNPPPNYWQTAGDWQRTTATEGQHGQTAAQQIAQQEVPLTRSALPTAEPLWPQAQEYSKPPQMAAPPQMAPGPMAAGHGAEQRGMEQRKAEQPGTDQWLFAAERRYQQLDHTPGSSTNRTVGGENGAKLSAQGFSTRPSSDQRLEPTTGGYGADRSLSPSRPIDDYSLNRASGIGFEPLSSYTTGTTVPPETVNTAQRSVRRSNLLPRMSSGDVRAIQHEIATLYNEVENRLPASHESRERAHYLLQKAQTILKKDATRSAEVDYYIQQVRTILGRIQETLIWSNLYQNRLRTYLLAWVFLSVLVLLARYLYQAPMALAFSNFANLEPSSLLFQNYLAALGGFFGGTLGGAIGTFYEMQQQTQRERSFFDRKFGLRGLILPLLSAFVGLIVTGLLAILYWMMNQDPYNNLLLGTASACIAFAFGLMQETIYGTRD